MMLHRPRLIRHQELRPGPDGYCCQVLHPSLHRLLFHVIGYNASHPLALLLHSNVNGTAMAYAGGSDVQMLHRLETLCAAATQGSPLPIKFQQGFLGEFHCPLRFSNPR